eukprot:TRINITY_DN2532_c0_g1_i1.p1 TRINITY_DN2532_c0_g1~~TRINITY_DN2532_c0_g1_i1.p1  ORF type:complete len:475 (+),score=30.30 TRINITY_DN2532_c0_g1_i1:3376-4800(+)
MLLGPFLFYTQSLKLNGIPIIIKQQASFFAQYSQGNSFQISRSWIRPRHGRARRLLFCLPKRRSNQIYYTIQQDAFWLLANIIENYGMKGYFIGGVPNIKKAFYVHLSLLRKYLPKLFQHFVFFLVIKNFYQKVLEIAPSMYCATWFITLYAFNWPINLVSRIWDLFLFNSTSVVQCTALTLLKISQCICLDAFHFKIALLLKASWEKALDFLQNPWEKVSPEKLWDAISAAGDLTNQIAKLEAEYNLNPDQEILAICAQYYLAIYARIICDRKKKTNQKMEDETEASPIMFNKKIEKFIPIQDPVLPFIIRHSDKYLPRNASDIKKLDKQEAMTLEELAHLNGRLKDLSKSRSSSANLLEEKRKKVNYKVVDADTSVEAQKSRPIILNKTLKKAHSSRLMASEDQIKIENFNDSTTKDEKAYNVSKEKLMTTLGKAVMDKHKYRKQIEELEQKLNIEKIEREIEKNSLKVMQI